MVGRQKELMGESQLVLAVVCPIVVYVLVEGFVFLGENWRFTNSSRQNANVLGCYLKAS